MNTSDEEFIAEQILRREKERPIIAAEIERDRMNSLAYLESRSLFERCLSVASGWDLFWTLGLCWALFESITLFTTGTDSSNSDSELSYYLGGSMFYGLILGWNLSRKLKPLNDEIAELHNLDIGYAVEQRLTENTERENRLRGAKQQAVATAYSKDNEHQDRHNLEREIQLIRENTQAEIAELEKKLADSTSPTIIHNNITNNVQADVIVTDEFGSVIGTDENSK